MNKIDKILNSLEEKGLSETAEIIRRGNLTLHPAVSAVSIHGSRGPGGGFRQDSDLDLSLLLKKNVNPTEDLCREILVTTLENWQGEVELDGVVVFDKKGCGLSCFNYREFRETTCNGGIDCLGLYKIQRGFSGFVEDCGVRVELMFPFVKVDI